MAPFLTLDGDPYPVAVDGKVLWIVDAYTTSAAFPYSQVDRLRRRHDRQPDRAAPVAAGQLHPQLGQGHRRRLHRRRRALQVRRARPGARDVGQGLPGHPAAGERHLGRAARAPALPGGPVQGPARAARRATTCRTPTCSSRARTSGASRPTRPRRSTGSPTSRRRARRPRQTPTVVDVNANGPDQPPYYALLQFPGQPAARFSLSTSLVAANRPNLAAFVSVSSDPQDYGTLRVLQMPPQRPAAGAGARRQPDPGQQGRRRRAVHPRPQRPAASRSATCCSCRSARACSPCSRCTSASRGPGGFPTLQRIIVSFGTQTASGANLSQALTALLAQTGSAPGGPPGTPTPTPTASPSATPTPSGTATPPADLAAAVAAADEAFSAGQAALARGDFAEYGRQQDRLRQAIERLTVLQGSGANPAPTPTG